jgi:PAS domain S-box-containing protein
MFIIDRTTVALIYAITLMLSIIACIILAIYIWRRRPARGTFWIAMLMIAMSVWSASYLLQLFSPSLETKIIFSNLTFISKTMMPVFWIAFAMKYSRLDRYITTRNMVLLMIFPVIATAFVWTNNLHHLVWTDISLNFAYPVDTMVRTPGIFFWLGTAYCYGILIAGVIMIIRTSFILKEINNKVVIITTGLCLPIIVKIVTALNPNLLQNLDITPLVFTACWSFICWFAFRYRLLDIVPIARDTFIEQMEYGVMVTDMDGSLLYFNQAARNIVCRSRSNTSVIGKPVESILPCCVNLRDMTNATTVINMAKPNKDPRYYEIHVTILRDHDKSAGGYLINMHDITERKNQEELLRQHRKELEEQVKQRTAELSQINIELKNEVVDHKKAEAQLRIKNELIDRILATTPTAVAVIDNEMNILLANPVFCRTFGLEKDNIAGSSVMDVFPIADWVGNISTVLKGTERELKFEFKQMVAEKERSIIANLIKMQKNELLLNLIDITDERERQERLYFTDRLASIGQISAGIAHELNNPLTSIISLSQLLMEGWIPDDIKDELDTICSEAQRAGSIVRGLLAFSRHQAFIRQSVQINDILWEVLKLRSYEHRSKQIRVITEFAPGLPEIMADSVQMQQVFMNIIVNAEDAMAESGNTRTLNIVTSHEDKIIKISFADDGTGIMKDKLNRIFEPFFTTKSMGKGTGLGLSICYGIVTKHSGKIYAKSKPGKGTTFFIELPIETPPAEAQETLNDLYAMEENLMAK